jgi:cytochrome c556
MTAGDGPVSTGHNRLAALAAERRPFDVKAISDALAALERAVA